VQFFDDHRYDKTLFEKGQIIYAKAITKLENLNEEIIEHSDDYPTARNAAIPNGSIGEIVKVEPNFYAVKFRDIPEDRMPEKYLDRGFQKDDSGTLINIRNYSTGKGLTVCFYRDERNQLLVQNQDK